MKRIQCFLVMFLLAWSAPAAAKKASDTLCARLKAFVASVEPNESRELIFHTIWAGNFRDSSNPALFAKRCDHNEYAPAKSVCDYLMEYGRVEFSEDNLTQVLLCLSPKTRLGGAILQRVELSLGVDTSEGWSDITVEFDRDATLGGMALRVAVSR